MVEFASIEQLKRWLRAHGIDYTGWGQVEGSKRLIDLWAELQQGETVLAEDPPRRLVEVARVVIRRGDRLLIETSQELQGGRRRDRNRLPSEKIRPGEDFLQAAARCLQEEMGVEPGALVLRPESYQQHEWQGPSDSYPGLYTHYTFHVVAAIVPSLPEVDFATEEQVNGPGEPVQKHYWAWVET